MPHATPLHNSLHFKKTWANEAPAGQWSKPIAVSGPPPPSKAIEGPPLTHCKHAGQPADACLGAEVVVGDVGDQEVAAQAQAGPPHILRISHVARAIRAGRP